MATEESNIQQKCRIEASKCGARVFRNNRGLFYTIDGVKTLITLVTGGKLKEAIAHAKSKMRMVRAGLEVPGSSDLVGWLSVEITPEMVGKRVAIFCAPEIKKEGSYASPEQKRFHENVVKDGGIAGIVRSPEELRQMLSKPLL